MSKDLVKSKAKLEREARSKAAAIRRIVQEYTSSIEKSPHVNALDRLRKQREIERVVAEYIQLHKSLKRVRKKLGRAFQGSP